jgi:hypothetical protein
MGIKEELKKTIDNVGDAISEATHRGNAEGERAKREVAGDALTPGEKLGSVANEGKERVLAEVDRTKRDVRENI